MKTIQTAAIAIFFTWILMPCPAYAQHSASDSLDQFIQSFIAEYHIPGLAAAIVKDGEVRWMKGYGYADIEQNKPMRESTLLNIGSISKTFTATAVMQLWEQGRLELDADINTYLSGPIRSPHHPDIPITVQHLLTHTSSIRDGAAYDKSYACGDPAISLREWVEGYFHPEGEFYNAEENFYEEPPGKKYAYSNVGFGVLGLIVEEITGTPLYQYSRENIFTPLQMDQTGWLLSEVDTTLHARPYFYVTGENVEMLRERAGGNGLIPSLRDPEEGYYASTCLYSFPNYSDGLVRTSAADLSNFLIMMLQEGVFREKQILKKETIRKMLTPQLDDNEQQGLCWYNTGDKAIWGHGGGDPGITTGLYFNPELNMGLLLLQNSNEGNTTNILLELYRVAKEMP